MKEEKLRGFSGGEGRSGDDEVGLLASLDILSVKKEAKEVYIP